jgi:hypothetical protein
VRGAATPNCHTLALSLGTLAGVRAGVRAVVGWRIHKRSERAVTLHLDLLRCWQSSLCVSQAVLASPGRPKCKRIVQKHIL